jgi:hypothetical protein
VYTGRPPFGCGRETAVHFSKKKNLQCRTMGQVRGHVVPEENWSSLRRPHAGAGRWVELEELAVADAPQPHVGTVVLHVPSSLSLASNKFGIHGGSIVSAHIRSPTVNHQWVHG